jgi:hypothetical protein
MNPLEQILHEMDKNPGIPVMMGVVLVVLWMLERKKQKKRENARLGWATAGQSMPDDLDTPLFHWTPNDPYTKRDHLNGG